jgi:hypothetical protein
MRALLRNVGLPRNSKIGTGKIWPAPEGARRAKAFEIYRFDPDRHEGPRSHALSRSAILKGAVRIYPLPHLPVIKDLVPDMTDFFAPASAASCRITLRTLPFGRISRPVAFLGMSDFFT